MIQRLKESLENAIGFKFADGLTENEYDAFIGGLETIIANNGKIRLLLVIDHPQSLNMKVTWDYLIFWIKHIREIERLAIVGQREREKWLELLEKPFIHAEVKHFKKSDIKDAWNWIKSPSFEKVV